MLVCRHCVGQVRKGPSTETQGPFWTLRGRIPTPLELTCTLSHSTSGKWPHLALYGKPSHALPHRSFEALPAPSHLPLQGPGRRGGLRAPLLSSVPPHLSVRCHHHHRGRLLTLSAGYTQGCPEGARHRRGGSGAAGS